MMIHQVIRVYINFCTIAALLDATCIVVRPGRAGEVEKRSRSFCQTGKYDSPEGKPVLMMPVQTGVKPIADLYIACLSSNNSLFTSSP